MTRDYAYEALADVSSTDMNVGRGELNAALKAIRSQEPALQDSYLLACEIFSRAKMYRAVYENASLTPSALAKHWKRVKDESKPRGTNMHAGAGKPLPPTRTEQNLAEAQKLMKAMGWR